MEIEFPQGLPGFEHERRFTLSQPSEFAPLVRLQSIASPAVSLWTAPVDAVDPDYALDLSEDDLHVLGFDPARPPRPGLDIQCLVILCATENGPLTANLLAPVVINLRNRRAVQSVRSDRRYSHQHPLSGEAAC